MTGVEIRFLDNPIRPYAWGSRSAIAALQSRAAPSEGPEAELWIGAHPLAPSLLEDEHRSLADWIAAEPDATLGPESRTRFGDTLPFLLKILAAERPLSLQAHPSRVQARRGFAHEERAGIPLTDARRNYRDANHKPELLVALEPFHALCGFCSIDDAIARIRSLGLEQLTAAYERLRSEPRTRALQSCCEALWELPVEDARTAARQLVDSVRKHEIEEDPARAALWRDLLLIAEHHPEDRGLLFVPLLQHVVLEPGQALFLEAGCLHSYLHGVGVELMANSDNVLRGGLTAKHIDAGELQRIVRFERASAHMLLPSPESDEHRYAPGAEEFALLSLQLDGTRTVHRQTTGPELVLCTSGDARIGPLGGDARTLPPGQAAFVPARLGSYSISGRGHVFVAGIGDAPVSSATPLSE